MDRPEVVRAGDLSSGQSTPGIARLEAFTSDQVWVGRAHTDPGVTSGWHHHADHRTYVYVAAGALRLEFGPGGTDAAEAGAGDFVFIPPHAVHRESNPSDEESELVLVRVGTGEVVVNVDGPSAS